MISKIFIFLFIGTAWAASVQNENSHGSPIGGRIIGGSPAQSKEFPYVVAFWTTTPIARYFCGGALINPQWILTAGHCVQDGVVFNIQLGSTSLNGNDPNRTNIQAAVKFLHPEFDPETLVNDIGLIQLPAPVAINDFVGIIQLPDAPLADNTVTTAVGWGQVNDDVSGPVNDLQKVVVVTLTNEHCRNTYQDQITDDMVCVLGAYNEGTCIGDMGSPLILRGTSGPVHVGVASFISSNGCENIDPSGFTRTFEYIDWIKSVTQIA